MNMNETLSEIKKLIPNIKIREQPEASLSELLKLEKEYNMTTNEAFELYVKLDEEIHHTDKYDYLKRWISEYSTFLTFKGDITLLNSKGGK